MDRALAYAMLESMCAKDEEPTLSDVQLGLLVDMAEAHSWNLRYAAREGWLWKAAAAASKFGFGTDSDRFDRQQQFAHCMTMAATYGRGRAGSVPLSGPLAEIVERQTPL